MAIPRLRYLLTCIRIFTRYGLPNSVISPACLPETGSSLAERGLCHFTARLAMSAMIFSSSFCEMSPGSGIASNPVLHTDEYDIHARLEEWGYGHKTVCHARGEYARDEDGDGFCEVHVNTMEGVWSLLRSWLRPHRGLSQEKLPLYLAFFQFVHNARCRGKALLGELVTALVA